jgi:hypothetical protein
MAIIWVGLFLPLLAGATTYYVATTGSDAPGNPGTNWATALLTISNGVAKASAGEAVLVSNGTYLITATISVSKGITVVSTGGETIVDANYNNQCFLMNNTNAVLDGFVLTRGKSIDSNGGAAIRFLSGAGTVRNCVISNNQSVGYGVVNMGANAVLSNCWVVCNVSSGICGGVTMWQGALMVGCLISNNIATNTAGTGGGGICFANNANGVAVATNCTIVNNISDTHGGGVYFRDRTGAVWNCTISGNYADNCGGGIYSPGGSTNCVIWNSVITSNQNRANYGGGVYGCFVYNSLLHGNSSSHGGGAYGAILNGCTVSCNQVRSGSGGGGIWGCIAYDSLISNNAGSGYSGGAYNSSLSNCVVINNVTVGSGGGVSFYSGQGTVQRCVIRGNRANGHAGGVFILTPNGAATLRNCLICDNYNTNGANNGGGIYLQDLTTYNATGIVESCTIVSNYSAGYGGGIYFQDRGWFVTNCIVYSNKAASLPGQADAL